MAIAASEDIQVGQRPVRLTRADKVLFPDDDIDKRQLVEYYQRIAPTMLPYLRNRPVTMERFPDGIHGARRIQKRVGAYFPSWIRVASMPKQGGTMPHVICQ